ncbi:hypothetical protein M427DRAFT_27094 [Gonapodya prolifera JEL478]|uniref:Uncharacterized protein n=1 Tax=Gonapodya prolifera (strain JEL478) TaxID=1344416 RepID=A0A139B199_GONPJ|nr:hypothetical protein M427DRAFT_27094 [Gonapodya prolifera JEL478]|eukprot:KXS22573.1 hypothetical protein M427DRAFT_27094 [Gonapodya prolifera JEL478]
MSTPSFPGDSPTTAYSVSPVSAPPLVADVHHASLPPLPPEALMAPANVPAPPSYEKAHTLANVAPPPSQVPQGGPLPSNQVQPVLGGGATYVVQLPVAVYDMSKVPQELVMRWDQRPDFGGPSTAETRVDGDGDVRTYDVHTAFDPNELLKYFLTLRDSQDRPQLIVRVMGSHIDKDANGHHHTNHQEHQRTVTDFDIMMDASNYISPQWSQMVALQAYDPTRALRVVPTKTIAEVLGEFTRSENLLKEIHLRKQVLWDFDQLTPAIVVAVRSTGYGGHISVTYPTHKDRVTAKAPNSLAMATDSCLVKTLCVLSCLWIIFWPAWVLYRKKVDALVVEFPPIAPGSLFYQRNYYNIVSACMRGHVGPLPTY